METKKDNIISEVKWFVPLELSHSSYIYTSLIEFCELRNVPFKISFRNLNKRGLITLAKDSQNHSNHFNPKITWAQISFLNGNIKMLAFDLNDNPNCFGVYALKNADIYYKRCYQEELIDVLASEFKSKIKSLGLPFMVRPRKLLHLEKVRFTFYAFKIIELFKFDRLIFRRIDIFNKKAIQHFKGFKNTRTVSDFNNFNSEVLGNIFYQKRLFQETSIGVKMLNQERIRIIKLLKKNFADNFFGGLQRNQMSEVIYSDILSNIDGDQHVFLEAMRQCGICIYTNGLIGSPGWTLPEFLSQGKCIVAQKLENISPHPLINNKHVVFFSNEKELITICNELINDPEKRQYLGRNARKYYEEYISPTVFLEKLLTTICE